MSEKTVKTQGVVPIGLSLAGLALLIAGIGWYGYSNWLDTRATSTGTPTAVRREAPAFRLKDSQGREHTLAGLSEKWVIVHFWATWCPPCLDEIPAFLEFAKKMHDAPVAIIAISLDSAWSDALKMLPDASLAPGMVSLLDPSLKVPEAYGSYQFPETYLLSPSPTSATSHRIRAKWVGAQDWNGPQMEKELREVFKTETDAALGH